WRQRDAPFHETTVVVERRDLAPAAGVVAFFLQFGDDALDDAIGDRLVIGRDIALPLPAHRIVKIQLADFERVLANGKGDFLDHALRTNHALRPTETAKRGIG